MVASSSSFSSLSDRSSSQDSPYWQIFVAAKTADERAAAWLALISQRIGRVSAAAVLIENAQDHSFVPLAVWPKASPDLSRLGEAVSACIKECKGVVKPAENSTGVLHIAYPLLMDEQIAGLVALEVSCHESKVADIFREIHWGGAWLVNLLSGRALNEAVQAKQRLGSVLETTTLLMRHKRLQQALFDTCNALRQNFDGSRVALALVVNDHVKLTALSETATFEKHSTLAKNYQAAMEEAFDYGQMVTLPQSQGQKALEFPLHVELCRYTGAGAVLSVPLMYGARCVAVITIERVSSAFSKQDILWLDAFAGLAAPIIEHRRQAERSAIKRVKDDIGLLLERLFGPRYLTWKVVSCCLLFLSLFLSLVPFDYRVSAKTVIEGEVQRVVAAPFNGFISHTLVRAGYEIKQGQLLAQLDDRDLLLEKAKWSGERDQYQQRLREAWAKHDLTQIQVNSAQLKQSEAELNLVLEKIQRVKLVSPFDGIVVSGDLNQKIGAPVEKGEQLFEVAPLKRYRIILQVDERDIRFIEVGQSGQLVMTGIASEPMGFQVANVTPVATAEEGNNFFRVEASLAQASLRLRPGMEGVGKIEVGERSLWWIMTHKFNDWLVLNLWSWFL